MESMLASRAGDAHWQRWAAIGTETQRTPAQEVALRVDPEGSSGAVRDDAERQRTLRCYQSHVDLWKWLQLTRCQDATGACLILEDDVVFGPRLANKSMQTIAGRAARLAHAIGGLVELLPGGGLVLSNMLRG